MSTSPLPTLRPQVFEARLGALTVIATMLWMPLSTLFIWYIGALENPLVLAVLSGGWIASAVILLFPVAISVDHGLVTGRWLWGRARTWKIEQLRLAHRANLFGVLFGGRLVKREGRTMFIVWSLMTNDDLLLDYLAGSR